jgi:hypothetical protein
MRLFRSKHIVISVLLICIFSDLNAQLRTDYVIGLNISTMTMKDAGVTYHMRNRVGLHFGQIFDISINDNLALQPGLLLTSKGSNYKIDTSEYSISPIFLEVPVNVAFSAGLEWIRLSAFGGAYVAYGVGGYRIDPNGDFRFLSYGSGGLHDMKPFDFGLNYGVGISIKGMLLSVRQSYGLTNLSSSQKAGSEVKNRVTGISVSALFTGK